MAEMALGEIDILSAVQGELYAYIQKQSLGKDWPAEIVHNNITYYFEAKYDIPAQMRTYVQAARYLEMKP